MLSETLLGMAVGIGLSAACGFRVFVPLLTMNVAALTGYLHLAPGFEWIGSYPATIAFGTATVVEVLAYYIPWLDHFLDLIASPAAIIAGTIATASMVMELSPFLKWTLAIIAGGGAAALIQGATVALRTKSSALTGGMGNPLVSTAELVGVYCHSPLGDHRPNSLPFSPCIALHFCHPESRPFLFRKNER